jgi:hypothetical protein
LPDWQKTKACLCQKIFLPCLKVFLSPLPQMSLPQIAKEVARPFIGDEIIAEDLSTIIEEALNFDIPLVQLMKTCTYWNYFMDLRQLLKM